LFLADYALKIWKELHREGDKHEADDLESLKIRRRDHAPPLGWVALQTIIALVAIFTASRVFMSQLDAIGPWLGMSPQLVARFPIVPSGSIAASRALARGPDAWVKNHQGAPFIAVTTAVLGPSSGVISAATARKAGAFTLTMT
jgi:hypothetical protein